MKSYRKELWFNVPQRRGFLNITRQVEECLRESGIVEGDVILSIDGVPHGLLVARHSREILDRVHGCEIGDLKLVEVECDKWDIINAGIHWFNFFVVLTRNEAMDYVITQCDRSTRTYRDGMQVETFGVSYAQTQSGITVIVVAAARGSEQH